MRQKSRRDRVVDLLEGRALPALNDYVMRERPADADCPWVFLVGGRGKRRCEPLSYDALVRMFARAAGRAGVRDAWLTPHSLRHTHATRMFEGGMRELTLMTRLGHATPDSMKVYTRVSDPEVAQGLPARDRRGRAVTAAPQRSGHRVPPLLQVPCHCPEAEYAAPDQAAAAQRGMAPEAPEPAPAVRARLP